MSKKKHKVTWLNSPFPAVSFYYCVCNTDKKFKNALKHLSIPKNQYPDFISPDCDAMVHTFIKNSQKTCVVCINKHEDRDQIICLLAHEAVHMLRKLKETMGEEYSGDEFDAYCVQMMLFEMVKQI